jgi:hypothetical protein
MVKPAASFVQQIEESRMVTGCQTLVEKWAEKVPYLAKNPQAGAIVFNRVKQINDNIRASGQDLDRCRVRQGLGDGRP